MRISFGFIILFPAAVWAGPFIQSDPYLATTIQPTHCVATEGTRVYSSPVAPAAAGDVYCKIDITGVSAGQHTMQVKATSTVEGVTESPSVPFAFTVGIISAPASLRLVP